jgi:hypothetical protein
VRVDVRPAENIVDGDLTVRFTPDIPTDRLVFRLWPNGPALARAGAHLDAGPVAIDGATPHAGDSTNPTTLVVALGRTLAPHESVTATLPWKLTLAGPVRDRVSRSGDTVRLGSFFPILAWEPGRGWAQEPPTTNFAEASTAPVADFDLDVTVPPGRTAVVSGEPDGPGHWTATAMRDIAVAVGSFRVAEGIAYAPQPVHVTVAVAAGLGDDPVIYRDTIARVLEDFGTRFGPYPWRSYAVSITPGLKGGIEYPGHVLQGPGSAGRTTPHEIGHQWFYGLVGDDQGRDPWLDEGLATWAEARFLGNLDSFRRTSIPGDAAGRLGAPMAYWEGRASYYRGVYVLGAQALAALGDPSAVDCALRHYVAANAFRIARPEDLRAALAIMFPQAGTTLARYGAATP